MKLLLPILVLIITSYLVSKIPHEKPKETVKEVVKVQPRPVPETPKVEKLEVIPTRDTTGNIIVDVIRSYQAWDIRTAVAVALAESGLNPRAQGWNCRYDGRSKPCKIADRPNAWSVDCGVFQINTLGTVCPERLFDPEINIEVAYKMFLSRKWKPWSAYNSGAYLVHL